MDKNKLGKIEEIKKIIVEISATNNIGLLSGYGGTALFNFVYDEIHQRKQSNRVLFSLSQIISVALFIEKVL